MAVETKEVTVGDKTYMITMFPATTGLKHMHQLIKLLGASMAAVMSDAGTDLKDVTANPGDLSAKMIQAAVEQFIADMDNVDTVDLIKSLLLAAYPQNGNQPVAMDLEFAGNYGAMFQLVLEVVKYNFGSVFSTSGFDLAAQIGINPQ